MPIITLIKSSLYYSKFTYNITSPIDIAIAKMLKALLARTTEVGSRILVVGVYTRTKGYWLVH